MENSNIVVTKKKSAFWTVVGILLAVAAACLIAAKVYQKFFKKKKDELAEPETEDAPLLDVAEEAVEDTEEATFEVPAEAVIANAEDME